MQRSTHKGQEATAWGALAVGMDAKLAARMPMMEREGGADALSAALELLLNLAVSVGLDARAGALASRSSTKEEREPPSRCGNYTATKRNEERGTSLLGRLFATHFEHRGPTPRTALC